MRIQFLMHLLHQKTDADCISRSGGDEATEEHIARVRNCPMDLTSQHFGHRFKNTGDSALIGEANEVESSKFAQV